MVSAPALNRLTVGEAVEAYLNRIRRAVAGQSLAVSTARSYSRDLQEFMALAGAQTLLDDLSPAAIDDIVLAYASTPDARMRPATRVTTGSTGRGQGATARFRQSVARLFSEATSAGWIEHNPMPRTKVRPKPPALTNPARKALSQTAAEALLNAPATRSRVLVRNETVRTPLRDVFLLQLVTDTNLSGAEVSQADRFNLDVRDGTTWLQVLSDGSARRWVPLSHAAVAAYQQYLEQERPNPRAPDLCPSGCGCRYGTDDPDRLDCACTGPCCWSSAKEWGWPARAHTLEDGASPAERRREASLTDAERALVLTPRGRRMRARDVQRVVRGVKREDQRTELRDGFLLRLLMEAGPRVSEVCHADRSDLEIRDDGTTWLQVLGKGSKPRWLPLSAATAEAYRRYVEQERPEPRVRLYKDHRTGKQVLKAPLADAEQALVLTWRGVRMQPRDLQYMVARACEHMPAEVRRRVTPHGLRHTAATLLLSSGAADIKTVQELLGHASMATTGLYLDTSAEDMARAVQAHPVTGEQRSPAAAKPRRLRAVS